MTGSPMKILFLELQRLKDLLLYYEQSGDECSEIESIFKTGTENSEAEIIGESFFNLGIITLTKALTATNENEYISNLEMGDYYFRNSIEEIENRVDSRFFQKVVLILKELELWQMGIC